MRALPALCAIALASILIWTGMGSLIIPQPGHSWIDRIIGAGMFFFVGVPTASAGLSLWRRRHDF